MCYICIFYFLSLQTSQDGGDSISATSGVENEIRKPKAGLLEFKSKKIGKRTAPNLSEESDDAVVEPLLQKTTDKTIESAKYFAKAKADTVKEISKLFNDKKSQYASSSGISTTESLLLEKDHATSKPNTSSNVPIHNYMNTNVFHSHDNSKANSTTKSQLLVEIDGSNQSGYNPSPLIFTTAKIHTDGKSKQMEPVQMAPGPILSTVEVSVSKGGSITTNEKKVSNGTSVMNTKYCQPLLNEKENSVNVSNSNKTPVTQSKGIIMTDQNSNPTKPFTTKANSPTNINEKIKESTTNISKTNITQNNEISGNAANTSKNFTTLSNNPVEICSSSKTSKSNSVDVKNKPDSTGVTNDTKKLSDEPRILMSESKLKSTISNNTKTSTSLSKSPLELNKTLESALKQPAMSQSNKTDKKSEKNNSCSAQDTKAIDIDIKGTQPMQNKNMKSPITSKELVKSNATSNKSLQQQRNTPTEVCAPALKTESSSSKSSESSNDPSAKTSSSTKTPTQPKVNIGKLSKEIDKSPKPSGNEIKKPNSNIYLNNTATTSTNKIPTSLSIVKPASNVSSSNVVSSGITDTSNRTAALPSAIKTQSSTIKTGISTANTKPAAVTSIKSSSKSSASSIKSPQIVSTSTNNTKQPNTSTAKTASGKPPPLAFTKTPPVNTSSPTTTTPTAKPSVSKIAQVSTSNPTGHSSSSVASPKATVDTSIKTKAPNLNKKGGSKPSPTKDTKVSKP